MVPLICSVRGCGARLVRSSDGRALRCPAGHAFDRARHGYWNLLQPQDRRSARPGDPVAAVEARRRWLDRGFALPLFEIVAGMAAVGGLRPGASAVDVGCGEGTATCGVLSGRGAEMCGVDLSASALKLAARRFPDSTWVVANADRSIPLASGSVDLALSVFGRRPASELARVVRPGGRLVVVVPGADDLAELREAVQGRSLGLERLDAAVAPLASAFTVVERRSWRARMRHDADALRDALAMTYRGGRAARAEAVAALVRLDVTLAADVAALVRR